MSKLGTTSSKKGFTLLEILLVIAAIGILAAIVIVAINPNRQLAQARNAQRQSDAQAILNAAYQAIIDGAAAGNTTFRDALPTTAGEIYKDATALAETGTTGCTGTPINMSAATASADVTPTYLSAIPLDPSEGGTSLCAGYTIVYSTTTQRITVAAPNAELGATISYTR